MAKKGDAKELWMLLLAGAAWYCASAVANTTSRQFLLEFESPLFLTLSQFTVATVVSRVIIHFSPNLTLNEPEGPTAKRSLAILSLLYTIGFVFVNLGYVIIHVSLAETLRSSEPVVSVVFAICFLRDEPVSWGMLVALLPIVIGGAMSSMGDDSFSLLGLAFVSVSNVSFSLRSLLTKKAKKVYSGDAFNIFYQVSLVGTVLLLSFSVILEMVIAILPSPDASLNSMIHSFYFMDRYSFGLLLVNSLAYTLYNQMSFYVLTKVEMVTHAVANAIRRTFTIVCSVLYFRNQINSINAVGIMSSIMGVLMYAKAKGVIGMES